MSITEDTKKVERFNEIEKIILSSEFDSLSIDTLNQYKRELPANIPQIDQRTYNPKCQHLMELISPKIDGIISSRRFKIKVGLTILALLVAISGLYLKYRDHSNTNEMTKQESKQPTEKKAKSQQ